MGSRLHAPGGPRGAAVLERLRAAGARIVAYANLHEWAIGSTSAYSALGPIGNPRAPGRVAGGSSGGSAAAVAAGAVPLALGTDAGGSIRCPAACCGVVGFKPTFGAVPSAGAVGEDSELNVIGPLALDVATAARAFEVLAAARATPIDPSGLVVAVVRPYFFDDLAPLVARACERALAVLAGLCRSLRDAEVEGVHQAAKAVSVLHLGHTAALLGDALDRRAADLHPETLAWLRRGRAYGPEDRAWARALAARLQASFGRAFERADVLVTPTLPAPAAPLATRLVELPSGPRWAEAAYLGFNAPMNLAGLPALSLPVAAPEELPVGLTLSGRPGDDTLVLALAAALEAALRQHRGDPDARPGRRR
jgi:aspartyl-tRNA(Asn)/glutamyl-tRNA(Gln) amidotransferase subunit A